MRPLFQSRPTGRQIALVSWQRFLGAVASMPVLFLGTAIIYVLLVLGAQSVGQKLDITEPFLDGMAVTSDAWFYAAKQLLAVVILLPLTLATCRFVLLDDTGAGLTSREGRTFILWAICLAILCLVLLYLRGMMSGAPSLVVLVTVFWVVMILTPLCCLLALPAIVSGEPAKGISARIETSLNAWNGGVWLFIRAAIFALGPIALLVYVPDRAIANRGGQPFLDSVYASQTWVIATAALTPFLVALVACVVSSYYAGAKAPRTQT